MKYKASWQAVRTWGGIGGVVHVGRILESHVHVYEVFCGGYGFTASGRWRRAPKRKMGYSLTRQDALTGHVTVAAAKKLVQFTTLREAKLAAEERLLDRIRSNFGAMLKACIKLGLVATPDDLEQD